jgi:hypothetical protein
VARRAVEQHAGSADWPDDGRTEWDPAPDHRVVIRRLQDDRSDDNVTVLIWERPHADPALRVRTEVVVGHEGERGWVVVRESLGSVDPTLMPTAGTAPTAPEVVRTLVREIEFDDAMRTLSIAVGVVGAERVLEVDAFLTAQRHLPVVVLADDGSGRQRRAGDALALRVAGLAHVTVLDGPAAAEAFARESGPALAVPAGGARLYWPRLRSIEPSRHPTWQPSDVLSPDGTPKAALLGFIARSIIDVGALRVPDPPLVARLEAASVRRQIAERRAERRERVEQAEPFAPPEPEVGPTVTEGVVTTEMPAPAPQVDERAALREPDAEQEELLEEALRELERTREHLARVESDRDRVQRDYDTMRDQWILRAERGETGGAPPPQEPLVEVVRRAGSLPHLVVLDTAVASARRWQFDRTGDVWAAFLKLERIAADWASGTLRGSFTDAARGAGLDWAGGIGDTAAQKYAADYLREFEGRQIMLGPHLRMSGGRQILRIYCHLDQVPGAPGGAPRRRLIVGHVGEHLRDQGADD